MGLSFNKFILFLAAGAAGLGAPSFANTDTAACVKANTANIKRVDEQLKAFGINPENPCPAQDDFDKDQRNCSESIKDLQKIDGDLRELMGKKCKNAEELKSLAGQTKGEQKDSNDKNSELMKEAKNIGQQELNLLKKARKEIQIVRKYYAELAEGAEKLQKSVEDKARIDGQGRDEHASKLRAQNNEQAKNVFKDALSSVSQAVSKAKGSNGISKSELDQVKTPLTKEPLAISAAAADWDKQVAAREKVVQSQVAMYDTNYGTTSGQSKNLGASSDDKTAGKTGEGTSSSGGSDAAGSMGDASKAMQAASGLAGAGGGGGASSADTGGAMASSAGAGNYDYAGGSATTTATNETSAGGKALSSSNGGKSSTALANLGKIENLDTLKTDPVTGKAISGASSNKGSSLRETLRERLAAAEASGGGGGASTTASTGASASGTGSNASSGSVSPDLLPLSMAVASDNPLEASEGSVGGDLGNTDFSLAGSETDAAVNGMLKDFGVGGPSAGELGDRSLASLHQAAPEILAAESASLFMRTRETHQRSLKKGLVINGLRAKL